MRKAASIKRARHDNDDTKSIKKGTAFHMGPISGHTGKDDGRISNLQDKLRNLALIIRRQDILFPCPGADDHDDDKNQHLL